MVSASSDRIYAAIDVGHIAIFKAAQHVRDGVCFTDVGEELIAETFALGSTFHETRDVYECHACRDDLLGACDVCERVEARIWHGDVAHIWFYRAERESLRLARQRSWSKR